MDHLDVTKTPTEALKLVADFSQHATRRVRQPAMAYALGVRVQPALANGFQYQATIEGTSATREPRWPEVAGQTVRDGSVTWTAEAVSGSSLERTLSSVAWDAGGITLGTPVTSGQESYALASGGTLGQQYEVTCHGTMSDSTIKAVSWTITIGSPDD